MGDVWQFLSIHLPLDVLKYVKEAWVIHGMQALVDFEGFELLRVTHFDITITLQRYVNSSWCVKIKY